MNKPKFAIALAVSAVVLASAGVVYARNIASYDLIVPRFGGTSYTSTLTKVNTSRAVDSNTSNGGGYSVNTAVYRPSTTRVTPKYALASGSRVLISYNAGKAIPASGYRLGHTNNMSTVVNVQSRGSWSPDEH